MPSLSLPRAYRLLLSLLALVLLLALGIHLFFLSPLHRQVQEAQEELETLRQSINAAKWPVQAAQLQQELQKQREMLDGSGEQPGLLTRNQQAFDLATAMLRQKLAARYASPRDFLLRSSRIDFQEAQAALQEKLRQAHPQLRQFNLGFAEEVQELPTSQLLLQLWTAETLWQTCQDLNLPLVLNDKQEILDFSVLPPLTYRDAGLAEEAPPFLLEFPVRLTVQGPPEQIPLLLQRLLRRESFLPLRHFHLQTVPRLVKGKLQIQARLTAICSAFFQPEVTDHE